MPPDRVHVYIAVVDFKVDPVTVLGQGLINVVGRGEGALLVPVKGKCLYQTKHAFAKEGIDAK